MTSRQRVLDPRHGTATPTEGTPPRRSDSIRRTSTVDSTHPHGFDKTLVQVGRARDLLTTADGTATVVAASEMHVRTEYTDGPIVEELRIDPDVPGLDALVGRRTSSGFRKVVDDETDAVRGSLNYLLLDDLPGATLVSGYAVARAARREGVNVMRIRLQPLSQPRLQVADLCAGFRTGGTMLASADENGHPPMFDGPIALSVESPDDEWAWHRIDQLPGDSMRRRRRIDVWLDDAQDVLRVDVFFRDSHTDPDGVESVVHEYTVEATVDPSSMQVLACEATPRVLPWRECPEAAASAGRLAGMSVLGLRPDVRAQFVGPPTCTHLNDVLRGLEDVDWLHRELRARTRR